MGAHVHFHFLQILEIQVPLPAYMALRGSVAFQRVEVASGILVVTERAFGPGLYALQDVGAASV